MKIENLCINCMREMKEPGGICEFCGFNVETFELPRHHMRPFTILAGKYLIGKAIGEGGFGITYLGIDLNLEVKVAIKEYYPQGFAVRDSRTNDSTVWSYSESTQTFFEEGREKFINEAKTIAKFRELPEIVGVTDFFRENQTAYIVMEYLDGQTLKQYLRANGGKIPAENVVRMMRPLIASLGKLHSQNLIHRDISPDNIMLMKNGSIKILDFGGAREFASQDGRSMSVLVKHGYAPEEQYRSRGDQGPWTDVYALCATMYRCITGEIPPNALDRLYQDELKPISSFGETCPKYIEKAITKGLNVRKDGRYQSMEELYEFLYKEPKKPEKVPKPEKKDQQEKKNKEEEQDSKQPDKKKKIMVAVAAVAVAAGVVVAAGVGMKMKQSDEKEVVAKVAVTPEEAGNSTESEEADNGEDFSGEPEDDLSMSDQSEIEEQSVLEEQADLEAVESMDDDFGMDMEGATEVTGQNLYNESGRFVIKIDGEDYTLPVSIQELESNGWECYFGDIEETEKYSGDYIYGGWAKKRNEDGGFRIFQTIGKINNKGQIDIVGIDGYHYESMELPGGILVGKSTMQDIQNIYGESERGVYYITGDVSIKFDYDSNDKVYSVSINKLPENYTPPQD